MNAFPLTYQQRLMLQSVSFNVYLHGLWVWENDIYFYFMPARFKRPFQIFMSSFFFLFYSLLVCVMWWENVSVSGVLFLSCSLAWGGKYIENLLVKLFTFSHNMSNNCKAVCSNNLGRPCIVTMIDFEVSYWTVSGIQSVTPGDNFAFVLPDITKEKSQRWELFLSRNSDQSSLILFQLWL